jgi:organic hydroperoxide reductase OsmC/OhrA
MNFPSNLTWHGTTTSGDEEHVRAASASIGTKHPIALSPGDGPQADATRWNPEDLLATSLGYCHMLTFLALARKVRIDVRGYDGLATAELTTVDKRTSVTTITLTPTITLAPGGDVEKARAMFEKAGKYCFIGNSLTSEVRYAPTFVVAEA